MKNIFFLFCLFLLNKVQSQEVFVKYGKIEFEKKVNLHKQIEGDSWLANLKDKIPQFQTTYFNLYFKDNKTLFEKGKEMNVKIPFFGDDRSVEDITFTDLQKQIFYKKQQVFEETFLIEDSLKKVEWRITNDTRDIAGFECHKAVGKVLDSVYVIAFYTDQIPVSGGPLSYCNLPGMILGIAVPRVNMTLFATKVEMIEPNADKLSLPKGKMKKTDINTLITTLKKVTKDWGDYGTKYIINAML